MARLVGTGSDPNGQYGAGVVFDVPRDDPHYAELVDNGWAEPVDPHQDPGRGTVDIANAKVRGDALSHPAEQDIAEHIGERAHAIVQRQDPDAEQLTANDDDQVRRRAVHANPDERPYEGGGNAATSDWSDGPEAGDLATHTTKPASAGEPEGSPRYPSDRNEEAARRTEARGGRRAADPQQGTGATADDETADDEDDTTGDEQATEEARALADAEGIDLGTVQGTGQDGRIKKSDVAQAIKERDGNA